MLTARMPDTPVTVTVIAAEAETPARGTVLSASFVIVGTALEASFAAVGTVSIEFDHFTISFAFTGT